MVTPRVAPRTQLAVDFDRTIRDVVSDEPLDGCEAGLRQLDKRYEMSVFTARHDLEVVHLWLVAHRLRHYFREITNRKPRGLYLDDNARQFTSWPQALIDL